LKTTNLTKTYGKGESAFTALRNVNLTVDKGESVAILGKSGSGKSTLMHILALLDTPTEGTIFVDGEDASRFRAKKSDLLRNQKFGFVFQQFFLNGNQSVLDNVILPSKIAGLSARERAKRGMETLKAVELEEKAKSKANNLSGGQKQRVVIARALINDPQVIFADEPTGNLDSVTGAAIQEMLFRLNKERGITLIVVTHDHDIAAKCDRLVEISDGKIVRETKK
ncbi:MAG TPA: ABC transporter ATP-binding protein, partial [Candidatus Saccharimonadales bacterium]|nr:ABC transporter ATP-binding protein [Candidatus Saccharimonadales bacterium]